jgi:hypothetical protein
MYSPLDEEVELPRKSSSKRGVKRKGEEDEEEEKQKRERE